MTTVSDVLTRAAALLDNGVCRGANARLKGGKPCGVFNQHAETFSMYGALCAVLGPGLGAEESLRTSAAWKLISLRAWDALPGDRRSRMEYALHDLNDQLEGESNSRAGHHLLLEWAADPEIAGMGEWA